MEDWIVWAIAAAIVYWSYKSGKRLGSRKGFNAGRHQHRRRNRRR